jgi:putative transposase
MKVGITVPEVIEIFNRIQKKTKALFEMIHHDLQQTVGEYLTAIMNAELTH